MMTLSDTQTRQGATISAPRQPNKPLPLATEINISGGIAKQLKRARNLAIYDLGSSFEVIVILVREERLVGGKAFYPKREVYPTPNQWGQYAWTWTKLERAEAHFDFLVKHGQNATPKFYKSREYWDVIRDDRKAFLKAVGR